MSGAANGARSVMDGILEASYGGEQMVHADRPVLVSDDVHEQAATVKSCMIMGAGWGVEFHVLYKDTVICRGVVHAEQDAVFCVAGEAVVDEPFVTGGCLREPGLYMDQRVYYTDAQGDTVRGEGGDVEAGCAHMIALAVERGEGVRGNVGIDAGGT